MSNNVPQYAIETQELIIVVEARHKTPLAKYHAVNEVLSKMLNCRFLDGQRSIPNLKK